MQKLMYLYSQIGNGDVGKVKQVLKGIAERLEHARTKHTKEEWENMGVMQAYKALMSEVSEVEDAIFNETQERVESELLDVIAVAVRMLNCEYKK